MAPEILHASPRRVLILGPPEVARLIARQLAEEGLDPVVHEERETRLLPSLADPEASSILRGIFHEFARGQAVSGGGARGVISARHLVHPGVSPWGERPELLTIGQEAGLEVIAPAARVLTLFSNTLSLLLEAERLGVPNLLISTDPLHGVREVEQLGRKLRQRFPYILKSVRGGTSPAHCVVHDSNDLSSRLPLWMEQLRRNSGQVMLVAERYLEGARHIVVPFARVRSDSEGPRIFPWIDASLQCRHRKLVEFCPALGLDPEAEKQIRGWVRDLILGTGYVGVGTLEFLVDGSRAFLINGSARLNVSFHLWERVAGTRAVAWQLAAQDLTRSAEPELKPEVNSAHGLAIRFFAEDPLLQLPQPGEVEEVTERQEWSFPTASAEASLLVGPGDRVSPTSTGLLGLLWAWGADRKQALNVARGVLEEFWIAGSLQTNERYVSELIAHPWVREGIFHSGFVDEEFLPSVRPPVDLVRVFASVCEQIGRPVPAVKWAVGDQWVKPSFENCRWVQGPEFRKVRSFRGVSGTIELPDGRRQRVLAYPLPKSRWQVRIGSWAMSVRRVMPAATGVGGDQRSSRIHAVVSGRIHSILYREGARVPAHEPILLVESLGMLVPHALPSEVRLLRWYFNPEDTVESGDELADFEIAAKI